MNEEQSFIEISKELGLVVHKADYTSNRQLLADKINELLQRNFQQLVSILYRMDVSETKLKHLLKDHPGTDAGLIIADLMIERQSAKIRSRQQFNQKDDKIDENEKW